VLKWLWLTLLVVVLDQASKLMADQMLEYHQAVAVIPFFNFTLSYNAGAAFSFLSDAGGWQRWFFILLATVISVIIFFWLKGLSGRQYWLAAALSLVLGGAIGNLIDRIAYGHVIDFIDIYYHDWHWPIFNIADSAIVVGVVILIADGLFGKDDSQQMNTA
jgi:signal peptidase II